MALSLSEQASLREIDRTLSASDPVLGAQLATFNPSAGQAFCLRQETPRTSMIGSGVPQQRAGHSRAVCIRLLIALCGAALLFAVGFTVQSAAVVTAGIVLASVGVGIALRRPRNRRMSHAP
jgi:hypothetical protein